MDTIKINSEKVKMVAHRGFSGLERENTYPAFVAAGNRSYFGVETDIHVTADGQFVVIHDETTNRISLETIDINVEENPYSAVENIILPDKDGSFNRHDIRIPLLIDYIRICKKYEKVCVLELKNLFAKEDIKRVVEIIRKEDYLDNMIFISFKLDNCIILRSLLKDAEIQWLTSDITDEIVQTLKKEKLNLDVKYTCLTKENIDMLHSEGIDVNCWTCDDKEAAEQLVLWGVDYITTNILE